MPVPVLLRGGPHGTSLGPHVCCPTGSGPGLRGPPTNVTLRLKAQRRARERGRRKGERERGFLCPVRNEVEWREAGIEEQ